ncbi:J domain-containing protein [Amycolatopsis sp. NPDC057786]|uniref:J domain-containing protein n=1 Tax=Amycolatopsis sp. NPDC057786 TaxID=3346250 RepID=UPI00367139AB
MNPYAVLGLDAGTGSAEITSAFRRAVRACHPDTADPDRERLAAVITAYHRLRDQGAGKPGTARGEPVRVRYHPASPSRPDLVAGPVRVSRPVEDLT